MESSYLRFQGTTLKEQPGARTGKENQTEPNTLSRKRPWALCRQMVTSSSQAFSRALPRESRCWPLGTFFRGQKREEAHWHLPCTRCFSPTRVRFGLRLSVEPTPEKKMVGGGHLRWIDISLVPLRKKLVHTE
jgi:hypothetical protein